MYENEDFVPISSKAGGKIIGPAIKHDMLDVFVPPCQDLSYINYKHTKIDKIFDRSSFDSTRADRICRSWRLPDTLFHQVQKGHQPVSSVGCRWGDKLIIFLVLINPKILSRYFMAIQTNDVQKHGEQPCWGSPCSITHNGSKTGP